MAEKTITTMSLTELMAEADAIRPKLQQAFREAGDTLDMSNVSAFGEGDDRFKSTQLTAMNLRHEELAGRVRELRLADESRKRLEAEEEERNKPLGKAPAPGGDSGGDKPGGGGEGKLLSLADVAMEKKSAWYDDYAGGAGRELTLEMSAKDYIDREIKTVISTGAGFAPQALRTGVVVPAAFQRPAVIDLIPVVPTDQNAYVFMRQTTRTNAAAEILESVQGTLQTAAESAFVWTEVSETLRQIIHWVPVTNAQLKYIAGMQALLDTDMRSGVRERLSSQILNGDGSAPNIEGFYDAGRTGVNQTNATGMNFAQAMNQGIEDVEENGFTEPDAIVARPSDWRDWQRQTTADGVFLNGHPSEVGAQTSWGLPIVLTTETAAGSALVGNFSDFSRLAVSGSVTVQISTEHGDFFLQSVRAVKAELEGATLAVLREEAFAEVTNIGS